MSFINLSLTCLYSGQWNKKWNSVSTQSEQNGQNRICFGIRLCRPTSIISLWLDNLNLVITALFSGFFIVDKYFSNPILRKG